MDEVGGHRQEQIPGFAAPSRAHMARFAWDDNFVFAVGIMGLGDAATDGWGNYAELGHQLGELGWVEGLGAVGEGVVGIVVDFDQDAVGACGYGGSSHGRDFVAAAGAVAGVAEHGEMRKLFDYRDGGDVEGVAGIGFKGADAA